MTLSQQQFLELLRSGLWGHNADAELFMSGVDWKEILEIARQQTVLVIVADGIETLPKELWPSKDMITKLTMVRVKTLQMHNRMNLTINQIVSALDERGIPSILLKGQGVARNYRKPESRSCGDIDLYVGEDNYEKACEVVNGLCHTGEESKPGIESSHHMHLSLNGIEVELHRKADYTPGKKLNAGLQNWTKANLDANFKTSRLESWDNCGTKICLPTIDFDAFFILHHAVRHMTVEGLGFRQVCDWMMFLHRNPDRLDMAALKHMLERFSMKAVWDEFYTLATDVLGLEADLIPLMESPKASWKTDKLLENIFISGNFGHSDKNRKDESKTTYIKRKWRSFRFQSMRLLKLFRLFPEYAFSYWRNWISSSSRRAIRHE